MRIQREHVVAGASLHLNLDIVGILDRRNDVWIIDEKASVQIGTIR